MDGLAERLRDARRDRGLSQEQLARLVGVSRSAVAQWETGRSGQLGTHLSAVASALEIEVGWLLDGAERNSASQSLLGDELGLLRLYRACSDEDRQTLMRMAVRFARGDG